MVTREGVVLDQGGRRVELPVAPSKRARPTAVAPLRAVAVAAQPVETAGPAQGAAELADIDLEEFDAFIEDLRQNIGDVSGSPAHDAAGEPVGLVLDRIPEGNMLRRMGLRPGDALTQVNMMAVTDMDALIAAFDKVAEDVLAENELFIVIELVRDQKPDTIILSIW
ncbi:MAG: hypothetical protein AMK73_06935 [Planctomycetes bacterium SM23_32]|nr:MAG: hypothetical protein AMK73_06935 [Planctomycetes bacterium SM23_32]